MVDVNALERAIEREVERFGVPGVGVGIVRDGEVVLARGFGQRDLDNRLPVDAHTLFPIGSSTKAFTASVVATLVDEGLIEWDTPVREYFPGFRMYDPVATEHLTVRDMLSHRSGLPRHDLLWIDNTTLTRADVVQRLRHLPPNKTFRQEWQYNNLMFVSAGALIERLLGCTWEEAVTKRLLEPLGMNETNFSVIETQKSDNHSLPYRDHKGELQLTPYRGLDLAGPAGSINSSIADMTRWLLVNIGDGQIDGRRVLSPAAVHELHKPSMILSGNEMSPVAQRYREAQLIGYGMGWFVEAYRDLRLVHHGGNVDGFSAMVSMVPGERIGVVVLTNRSGTLLRDALPYMVFDLLTGREPLPWGERLWEAESTLRASMREVRTMLDSRSREVAPGHPLADYAGVYSHPGYGDVSITLEDGVLVPHYNDLEGLTLRHRHFEVFEIRLEAYEAVIPLTFASDYEGDIVSVAIQFEGSLDPLTFTRQADPALSDPEVLGRYVGEYELGPIVASISQEPSGALMIGLMGERLALLPHLPNTFTIAGQPGARVVFEMGASGVERLVLEPSGVFTPVRRSAD